MSQTSEPTDADITVRDNPAKNRYEAHLDGELVGFADYSLRDDRVVFPHVEVDPRRQGRGIAGVLTAAALDDAVRRGLSIVPLCPFVVAYVQRNPDYLSHVADPRGD